MTILLPLLILALAVGAAEPVPCVGGLLLGPDTALVGMRHPEHTRAETVRFDERVPKNYAARDDGSRTCCVRGRQLSRRPRAKERVE
jgi:hypothetical protein